MLKNMDKITINKKWKRMRRNLRILFVLLLLLIAWCANKQKKQRDSIDELEETTYEEIIPGDSNLEDYLSLSESPNIRVLIKNNNYEQLFHSEVDIVFPDGGYVLIYQNNTWVKQLINPNETYCVGYGQGYDCDMSTDMKLAFIPAKETETIVIDNLIRNRTSASYQGRIEISSAPNGLVVVNDLPLEAYLCSVLPSEMPASYDMDALRAQAILARTYAYRYLLHPSYKDYYAHVDDSVTYQVYGNIDSHENSTQAVLDTTGILLFSQDEISDVYYYSTSCGVGTNDMVWGGNMEDSVLTAKRIGKGELVAKSGDKTPIEVEQQYLTFLQNEIYFENFIDTPLQESYEASLSWFRWHTNKVSITPTQLETLLQTRYSEDPSHVLTLTNENTFVSRKIEPIGDLLDIKVVERGIGGVVQSILICGTMNTYKIELEYNIRYILNADGVEIIKQDNTSTSTISLLPSGFFYLEVYYTNGIVTSYQIYGGGYGHGVGMSQNGANQMALEGISCSDILNFYFPNTVFVSYVQ